HAEVIGARAGSTLSLSLWFGNSLASIPLPKNDLAKEWRQRNANLSYPVELTQIEALANGPVAGCMCTTSSASNRPVTQRRKGGGCFFHGVCGVNLSRPFGTCHLDRHRCWSIYRREFKQVFRERERGAIHPLDLRI